MPSSTSDSCVRICACWPAGKTSMMRLIVCAAELVCSVPNVRWPVSAIFSAASTVSRSRISPIRTMSGSSRSAARSASPKLLVSLCTSRWLTRQFLCWWMYSIGSSIVRMCSWRSELILSIIAASVVDLPLPVGPVTSTRPRGRSASVGQHRRQAELAEGADLFRDEPVDGADRAALVEDVAAEARADRLDAEREVELHRLFEALLLRVGEHAVDQLPWCRTACSSGSCSRCRWPWTRTCGGVRGRDVQVGARPSRPVVFSSSGSVAIVLSSTSTVSRTTSSSVVTPVLHLAQAAHAQRDHAFVDRLAAQLECRRRRRESARAALR